MKFEEKKKFESLNLKITEIKINIGNCTIVVRSIFGTLKVLRKRKKVIFDSITRYNYNYMKKESLNDTRQPKKKKL